MYSEQKIIRIILHQVQFCLETDYTAHSTTLYNKINSTTEKVLLSNFYVAFHLLTQKLEPPCTA